MKIKTMSIFFAFVFVGLFLTDLASGADVVKIGYSGPLSGGAAKVWEEL
jgi:hypothetical protein